YAAAPWSSASTTDLIVVAGAVCPAQPRTESASARCSSVRASDIAHLILASAHPHGPAGTIRHPRARTGTRIRHHGREHGKRYPAPGTRAPEAVSGTRDAGTGSHAFRLTVRRRPAQRNHPVKSRYRLVV